MRRVITITALILSSIFLPWWIAVALAVIAIAYLSAGVSVLIAGILLDTLYTSSLESAFGIPYFFTITFAVVLLLGAIARRSVLE